MKNEINALRAESSSTTSCGIPSNRWSPLGFFLMVTLSLSLAKELSRLDHFVLCIAGLCFWALLCAFALCCGIVLWFCAEPSWVEKKKTLWSWKKQWLKKKGCEFEKTMRKHYS